MKNLYIFCLAALLGACAEKDHQDSISHGIDPASERAANSHISADAASGHHYLSPEAGPGKMQSPINIISGRAHDTRHNISLQYRPSKEVLKNMGHTVQLIYDAGSYLTVDQQQFDLRQFHFHTPSEHLIDGITYPLEMHLVHEYHQEGEEGSKPRFLVVGLLFKEGEENPFLAEFMESLPEKEGQTIELSNRFINVNNLINNHFHHFYHYIGSLTTHPYTEAVDWLVLKHVFEASPEQIEKLNMLEGNNARHIQALNNRAVEEGWY